MTQILSGSFKKGHHDKNSIIIKRYFFFFILLFIFFNLCKQLIYIYIYIYENWWEPKPNDFENIDECVKLKIEFDACGYIQS